VVRRALTVWIGLSLSCCRSASTDDPALPTVPSNSGTIGNAGAVGNASLASPSSKATPKNLAPSGTRTIPAPDCAAIRHCLASALPAAYDSANEQDVRRAALSCLGETTENAWSKRECLPVRFGRDIRSNRALQLEVHPGRLNCNDCGLSPHPIVLVAFTEAFSSFECRCRGYEPIDVGPGESVCGPGEKSGFDSDNVRGEVRFTGPLRSDYTEVYGFASMAAFDAIDGVPARTPTHAVQMLAGLPRRLPGSVQLHDNYGSTELHFITLEVARNLARLGDELSGEKLFPSKEGCSSADHEQTTVALGKFRVARVGSGCVDAASPMARAERAIRQAARDAKPRLVTSSTSVETCMMLDSLPKNFLLRHGTRAIELRYVDWLQRHAGED
jgi:hypothetical protein